MIFLRKSAERVREVTVGQDARLTFGSSGQEPKPQFGYLEELKEAKFAHWAELSRPRQSAEMVSYVHAGSLAFEDSRGLSGVLRPGDFQRIAGGAGLQYSRSKIASQEESHVFQFWLRPSPMARPGHEKRSFTAADRRGRLLRAASPGGAGGSLNMHQDAVLFSAVLAEGQHVVHTLGVGRGAWLHVVSGSMSSANSTSTKSSAK